MPRRKVEEQMAEDAPKNDNQEKIDRRKNLLEVLSRTKKLRINSKRRLFLQFTSGLIDGEVILMLHALEAPTIEFGVNKIPAKEQLPNHVLYQLVLGLKSGDIFDITEKDVEMSKPVYRTPTQTEKLNYTDLPQSKQEELLFILRGENFDRSTNDPIHVEKIRSDASTRNAVDLTHMLHMEHDNGRRIAVIDMLGELIREKKKTGGV